MARLSRFLTRAVFLALTVLSVSVLPVRVAAQEDVTEAQAAELVKAADEAQVRVGKAEVELKAAQAKATQLQSALTKLRTQISKAEKTVKEAQAKLKPEQDKVAKADVAGKAAVAAAKTARAAADAAKKTAAEAEAKAKAEETKATAATKALTDAQAALKTVTTTIGTATRMVTDSQAGFKTAEAQVTQYKPQLDTISTAFAAVSKEHVDKRRSAEQALIKLGKLVSFAESVAPVFSRRCLACHNAKTAKGRYNMENYAGILKGGESGAAVELGDADASTLVAMIEDGSMPKDAEPLTPEQIAAVKKWIQTGVVLDAGFAATAPLIQIMPKEPQPPAPDVYPVPIPITAVAFNHDGSLLATSGYHEVNLWNTADGKLVRRITNVAERVYDIDFTRDGQKIVIAAGTPAQIGEAKVFQISDGKLLGDLVRTADSVFAVALSPDESRLATAGADRAIRVYDMATQEQQLIIEDHADWVMDIAWSPDGSKMASGSRDKTSKVFDAKTGDSLVTFNGHGQPVYGVGFSPDSKLVVTSGSDKNIRTWNVGDAKQVRAIGGFGSEVFRIVVTPEGHVFSPSADKQARVHNVADGKAIRSFTGHTDWVYSVGVHTASKRVAAGSYTGEVRIWNLDDGKELLKFVAAPGVVAETKETAAK
ncbi:MAG: c-type cytochrome domain-containing protein [Planctomycetaceae bacterium]